MFDPRDEENLFQASPDTGADASSSFNLPEESDSIMAEVHEASGSSMPLSGKRDDRYADGLDVATLAGEILLASGAEIFRVQDTMTRILSVYETEPYNVYVISNAIMANVERGGQAKSAVVRYIPLGSNHLTRVTHVNEISRSIARGELTCQEAMARLQEVKNENETTVFVRALATGVGSAGFAVLAGGNAIGFIVAFITSYILYYFMEFLARFAVARIMVNVMGAMFVSTLALFIVKLMQLTMPGVPINFSNVIIGSIMQLVPGMSMTTAVREVLNTDYLSGVIRLIDVITLGFGIAFGVAASLWIFQPLLGVG